ncbi:glutamate synthase central domain-containing protein, partial [Sandarakinorhabdus limnophila]|uniref:glutamate synthase central domain-containing protein n=1 Tax=Sandarakinorhabdus limnophila TaxID=210512 RepID=UPI0026E9BC41
MTQTPAPFVVSPEERARIADVGMYRPDFEGDACGVGLVAATDGKPQRRVVTAAIDALKAVWHRGAVDADGMTGDGAGILVEIPVDFFHEHVERHGQKPVAGLLAVGQVFLPRTDLNAQEACRTIVESEIIGFGYKVYGWRQVPVDISCIGDKAMLSRPEIEQIMIAGPKPDGEDAKERFEKDLYLIRRRIEKKVIEAQIQGFYFCSLSCRTLIYKGLFLAESLSVFYPDLNDERFVSRFAIYHQRYSTNTFPQWWLAQPFRTLAHNGEINTIRGNSNWMKSHEIKMAAAAFGEHSEDIKPLIPAGASDTAALDAVFEAFVRSGRDAPTAKLMLIPQAWQRDASLDPATRAMYAFFASLMEPWDGPAALAMTDGRWVVAGLDRNALRPMRYCLTRDGLLITGSEAGMVVVPEGDVVKKGALGPGEMIAVDLDAAPSRFYADAEIKAKVAGAQDYASLVAGFTNFEDLPGRAKPEPAAAYDRDNLRRRQVAAGQTLEDMELILAPMVEDAKEAVGSMGDDAPLAVISENARNLSHFFRQNFSQVTNPPIDSLRETGVMSLKTRFSNLTNILDDEATQAGVMVMDSPVLSNRDWHLLKGHFGRQVAEIDCTFEIAGGPAGLRAAIARVRAEAETAVRQGKTQLFLTDEHQSATRAGIAMILATAGVHTHLVRRGLRAYASVNVRAAEALDTHYFAVLVGVGATTVNAYLAQEAIADRHARGLFGSQTLDECIARYKKAVDDGLLKIMAKMGIAVISSYRGG